jgi:hypothetical protein
MTLEEKIAQLNGYWFPKSGVLVDDQLRPALGNDKAQRAARATAWVRSRARRRTRTARRTSARARWRS